MATNLALAQQQQSAAQQALAQQQPLFNQSTLGDLMSIDPFYQAGMIDLANVRSFEQDPRLQEATAPLYGTADPTALAAEKKSKSGYTPHNDPLIYVRDINKPLTMKTAGTTTHEGIHNVLPQELKDAVARDAGSALGTADYSYDPNKESWQDYAYLGADFARDEIITRYLENKIYGEDEPFEEWMGEVDPYGTGGFNYITMMRPGQGPLGIEGLKKILARRVDPYLKKIAKRAHQNIEARPITGPKGPPSIISRPKVTTAKGPPSIISKKKTVKAKHSPHGGGPGSGGGGSKKGSPPTGTKGKNPWGRADGGLIDVPIPGRSRYI